MRTKIALLGLSLLPLILAACAPSGGASGEDGGSGGTGAGGEGASGGASTSSDPAGGAGVGATGGAGTGATGGAGGSGTGAGGSGAGGAGAGGDAGWGPEMCPSPPDGVSVGVAVGQQLPDVAVKDCEGNEYSLSEVCGAKGLWLFAAHGWCPLCQSVSSKAESLHDMYAAEGLATVLVVVQTGSGQPPTAEYCKIWRDQFGLSDVVTLYDPTGGVLDLWPGGSSSLSLFADADRVITAKLSHDGNAANIEAKIQEVLSP